MKDPYSVLGVNENATEDEIKRAYRELARKYHPDAYADNPLADLAQEKMQEINAAYDQIMNSRKHRSGNSGWSGGSTGSSQFSDIRNLIANGRYEDAQELLDGIPVASRDAEWYFLNGSVLYKRGWFDNAYTSFATACRMDPSNPEYRQALNQVQRQRGGGYANPYGGYRGAGYGNGGNDCDGCNLCLNLWCLDSCCECMGGDLIPCC